MGLEGTGWIQVLLGSDGRGQVWGGFEVGFGPLTPFQKIGPTGGGASEIVNFECKW